MTSLFKRLTALFSRRYELRNAPLGPVATLNVKAGDTVVVSYPGVLNRQQADAIRAYVLATLPDGVRALLLCDGLTLKVISGSATNDDQSTAE